MQRIPFNLIDVGGPQTDLNLNFLIARQGGNFLLVIVVLEFFSLVGLMIYS